MLPDVNGFEVCTKIKNNPATQAGPVVFVTAKDQTEDKVRGLQVGADGYIAKPFKAAQLVNQINSILP